MFIIYYNNSIMKVDSNVCLFVYEYLLTYQLHGTMSNLDTSHQDITNSNVCNWES